MEMPKVTFDGKQQQWVESTLEPLITFFEISRFICLRQLTKHMA